MRIVLCPTVFTLFVLTQVLVSALQKVENGLDNDLNELVSDEDSKIYENSKILRLKRDSNTKNVIKRSRLKKKDGRRKIAVIAVEKIVEEKLEESLQPLRTALNLIRLQSFTEAIQRQLSSLELIQSKLLTEYGELRAAVNEVGRHTLDLGRQVAGLDERLASFDRKLPHRLDMRNIRGDATIRNPHLFSGTQQNSDWARDALVSITSKMSSSESRIITIFEDFGNKTVKKLESTAQKLESKIEYLSKDFKQSIKGMQKTLNESVCPAMESSAISPSLNSRRETYNRNTPKFDTSRNPIDNFKNHFIYFPTDGFSKVVERSEREGKSRSTTHQAGWSQPPLGTSYKPENIEILAKEIAKQIDNDKEPLYRDCSEIKETTTKETTGSIQIISPASCNRRFSIKVKCVSGKSSGNGWTVIHQRGPWNRSPASLRSISSDHLFLSTPSVDFYRDWVDYKWGFGDTSGDYWLGNEYIHHMTNSGDYDLRIELQDWNSDVRWAQYSHFTLGNEDTNYTLSIGDYSGNAGNSLKHHHGAPFTTRDRDNDNNPKTNCADTFHGAWWFTSCHESHLNGRYYKGHHQRYGDGIIWRSFKGSNYSLKMARMMIRPSKRN